MRPWIFGTATRKVFTLDSLRTVVALGHGVGEVREAAFRRVRPKVQVQMVRLPVTARLQVMVRL
jgi:hypothetical protein